MIKPVKHEFGCPWYEGAGCSCAVSFLAGAQERHTGSCREHGHAPLDCPNLSENRGRYENLGGAPCSAAEDPHTLNLHERIRALEADLAEERMLHKVDNDPHDHWRSRAEKAEALRTLIASEPPGGPTWSLETWRKWLEKVRKEGKP